MGDGQVLDSQSFNKNYKVLKDTADWLSRQEEPDIDQLVPRVERAMQAYRICKDRLDKVQETLGEYLRSDGAETDEMADSGEQGDGDDDAF
jgi:exodeoxyribonuclease VII small subunit